MRSLILQAAEDFRANYSYKIVVVVQYIGGWLRNNRHGEGRQFGPRGEIFIGKFRDNEPFSGEGVYTYHNGDTFAGRYVEGKKHGRGVYTQARDQGATEGEWVRGRLEGPVTITYPTGTFQGTCADGRLVEGRGLYFFANGDRYDGALVDGRKHGPGRYVDERNGSVYDGEYVNGSREGYGVLTTRNGYTYEGEWHNGMKHGQGVLHHYGRLVHKGQWAWNRSINEEYE